MPKFNFVSHARPSMFAYPAPTAAPTEQKVEKVVTAVLSTTAKVRARAQRAEKEKEKAKGAQSMEVEPATPVAEAPQADAAGAAPAGAEDQAAKGPEPAFELLANPARVLPAQLPYLTLEDGCRYRPVTQGVLADIIVLEDTQPGQPEELVKLTAPTTAGAVASTFADEGDEPGPPEDFEWTE